MGTLIVTLIVIIVVALAIRNMIHDKRAGKSLQCGGSCEDCGHRCHKIK